MNPKVRRGLKYAEYAVVTALLVLSVYVAANYAFGIQTIYVVSDNPSSMSPTINYGDLALTFRTPFSTLHVGDIAFFHDPRGNPGIIVHRIVWEGTCGGELCFRTKGDNNVTNPTPDPWNLTAPYYLSQVFLVVPFVGYLSPAFWGFRGVDVLLPYAFIGLILFFVWYGRKVEAMEAEAERVETIG
ncbi:MAG: signal peptidase I [Nitrososphaerota archaeon]|nr:signal peptidase I [Nitrososphaerota archaeon]MDG7023153.1 signal peptidase I [Nitrososphaerota archaeon]